MFPNIFPEINRTINIMTSKVQIGEININKTMQGYYYE